MTPIYTSEEKKFVFIENLKIFKPFLFVFSENKPNDIPNRPQPERNPPPPQNEGIHRGANNFSFNVFGFPFLFGGFGFSFGNNNQNINRNSNIRAGGIMPSNFYIIFIMIALNVLLNFGPLFFGADYEYEEEEDRQYQKPKVRNANGRNFNKIHNENDSIWFLITMLFFFGIALLWKFLKKRY